ncbi:MAG: EAL domain-containing protein [Comamonas sp.]|nr:EAL domain-containing protein [Comamonas sp.]
MRYRSKLHRISQAWWPTATVLAIGSVISVASLQVMRGSGGLLPWVQERADWIIVGGVLATTALLAAIVTLSSHQRLRAQIQTQAKHKLLRHRTDRFKALFHQSAVGVLEVELRTGRLVSANTRFCSIVGYSQQVLERMCLDSMVHADDQSQWHNLSRQVTSGKLPHFTLIHRMLRSDGQEVWVEAWVYPLLSDEGQPSERHIALIQDVTERRLLQDQLQEREAYSGEMLRFMPVGLVVVGPQGNIEFSNHHFDHKTGWAHGELGDESALWRHLCADPQQHATLLQRLNAGRCEVVSSGMNMPAAEYLLRSKSGQPLPMEVSGRFLDGRILLTFVDLSQRKAAEAEIRWLGFYDPVTQLPNRRMLLDRLGDVLSKGQRPGSGKTALLLLDIDNFKSLNETLGHELGDALLRMVATRLANCIAGKHTLSRQGGDEFAVVLEDLPLEALEAGRATEHVGRTLLEALRTPFFLNGQDLHVTVSMGAVVVSGQGDTVEELLKRADLALYQAKSAGRDTLQFFDPSMQKAVSARVEMEKDLRLALERHEFDLYFQPQVRGDKVVGAEALLRWDHPVKGFIPPGVFVPAAEESGLIFPLGEWVLYAACRQLAHWAQDPQLAHLTMSVNVSPRQFYQEGFVQQVQQALAVAGARPSSLELELTEGMLLTDIDDTIDKMVQLKKMGVIFSLDDFGTGYSSLSYLKRLPLDKLKIDQSFVREALLSANDASIARTIVALGHSLGLQVIAEGVETVEQRDFLAANGCSYWQGYLFSRATPAKAFEAWVKNYDIQGLVLDNQ